MMYLFIFNRYTIVINFFFISFYSLNLYPQYNSSCLEVRIYAIGKKFLLFILDNNIVDLLFFFYYTK